jgi:hypothetical protein
MTERTLHPLIRVGAGAARSVTPAPLVSLRQWVEDTDLRAVAPEALLGLLLHLLQSLQRHGLDVGVAPLLLAGHRAFLSRVELGAKSGLHPDHIGRLERGDWKGGTRIDNIRKLAEALGVDPAELVE